MFTDKAQTIIDSAKDYAFSSGAAELTLPTFLTAVAAEPQPRILLAECLGLTPEKLLAKTPEAPELISCPGKLPLAEPLRDMLAHARELAEDVPDRFQPGLIDLCHLACAMAMAREICTLLQVTPLAHEDAIELLALWYENEIQTPALAELTSRLRAMRSELLTKVFGQDHAIHAFVEGVFNAEVVAGADSTRKSPRALFVFAGPPGVGKTYLSELGAVHLDRPLKRFDMSNFSSHQQHEALVGMAKSYRGAHPGTLTEFVEKNPNAILLFDEIEKAHLNTIQLFLQVLDAGSLEDKFHERNVYFRDTTIIFTTNAGRKLYDKPNESGVHTANANFHRRTILDALENEKDPQTGQPFFPAAICSRMATGYPILFNHLGVNELERVARAELNRVCSLLEKQYYKRVTTHDLLPMTLVLREGVGVDARTLRSQAETFVKTEIFKFCQLFKTDRLDELFEQTDSVTIVMEDNIRHLDPEVRCLFEETQPPSILLITDVDLADLYTKNMPDFNWHTAANVDDAMELLAREDIDHVLLDLWIGKGIAGPTSTIDHFDHAPLAAKSLDKGQELLRKIRQRLPNMPVFLLSLAENNNDSQGSIDEELFLACLRGGGARGMVLSHFANNIDDNWQDQRDRFTADLKETCRRLFREKAAYRLGQERKVLMFDTAPFIDNDKRQVTIRLRNLRLGRAIAALDAGEILEEVERPRTRFNDVIGAESAKEELMFFIDFLKNPKRFAALGMTPPKGILLHGPPGTGKTMLARAMAGESNVAFIPASASSFVTIWQGSGPQSIRDMFARARRYAPAIIFIDEIDAIGKVRTGGVGAAQATENTLNALLTEMDGFTSASTERPVFILAATNFKVEPEDPDAPERSARTLDPALVRRFSRTILVDLPDTAARKKYFTMRLQTGKRATVSQATIDLLGEKSIGMTIANLEQVLEFAGREAVKKNTEITDELLLEALNTVLEGEANEWDPALLERTAYHEAGHTVMYWLAGWWAPEVSIVARADRGGGMRHCEREMKLENLTREQLLTNMIRVSLGGRAAEMVEYGPEVGLSSGAAGDFRKASDVARHMICELGMDQEYGPLSHPEYRKHVETRNNPAFQIVDEAARKILKEELVKTQKLLEQNRQHLDATAKTLIEKNTIYRKDLEELLPPIPNHNEKA